MTLRSITLTAVLALSTLAATAAGSPAGSALLDRFVVQFEQMARQGPDPQQVETALGEMMAMARTARQESRVDGRFFDRYTRLLRVFRLVTMKDPEGILRPIAEREVGDLVQDVLGERKTDIGSLAMAITRELDGLRLGLGGAPAGPAAAVDPAWGGGPVKWIMTREEAAEWTTVAGTDGAAAFVERFWADRDSDPSTPDNEARATFEQRVSEADALFGTASHPGSLTDRGKVYVFLGKPSSEKHVPRYLPPGMGLDTEVWLGPPSKPPDLLVWKWDAGQIPGRKKPLGMTFYEDPTAPDGWGTVNRDPRPSRQMGGVGMPSADGSRPAVGELPGRAAGEHSNFDAITLLDEAIRRLRPRD